MYFAEFVEIIETIVNAILEVVEKLKAAFGMAE